MKIINDALHAQDFPPLAVTIGCFDGVHRGHTCLIGQVCDVAHEAGLRSGLITFPVHPRQVMQTGYKPELLTCLTQKVELMQRSGADYCILLPFTHELSLLSAREFMALMRDRFNVRSLVVGYDHRFGHNRSEGVDDYIRYGEELGIRVVQAGALTEDGVSVSSSVIRRLLKEGDVAAANRYLGYRYYLNGIVEGGYRVGRTLGFPTANLRPSCSEKLIPARGVYAVYAYIDQLRHPAMLNIGCRPTFTDSDVVTIEVNIIGFSGDIYNRQLRVELVERLRDETKFASAEELVRQIAEDKQMTEKMLG